MPRTLGSEIRAGRLGFHWSDLAHYYVRIIPNDADAGFEMTVCDPGGLPNKPPTSGPRHYAVWWGESTMEHDVAKIAQREGVGTHRCDEYGIPKGKR